MLYAWQTRAVRRGWVESDEKTVRTEKENTRIGVERVSKLSAEFLPVFALEMGVHQRRRSFHCDTVALKHPIKSTERKKEKQMEKKWFCDTVHNGIFVLFSSFAF